uniref:Uncharacterized protein n=1 Tax=Molossus molossus TaxID=27622 RepID=A0A7J8E307_MOLMO|nr:hypothetical protein HJG59_009008 [Molossus molossus]
MCVCNWPLPLHYTDIDCWPCSRVQEQRQLCHHHCLPESPAAGPGSITEDPSSSSSLCRSPSVLTEYHAVSSVDPSSLMSSQQGPHRPPHLVPCTTRPRTTARPACLPPPVKVFLDRSQSIKSRRGDCFFRFAETCARLQKS